MNKTKYALMTILAVVVLATAQHQEAVQWPPVEPTATPEPTVTPEPTALPTATPMPVTPTLNHQIKTDNSNLLPNPSFGTCVESKHYAVPKWFYAKLGAGFYTVKDTLALNYYHKYSGVGLGYISPSEKWAAFGLRCQGGKTLVRVWEWS